MPKYKATAYIRLSYTDDHSSESDSVSNQRKLIENFVERNPDIEVVSEKIDDGYSGIIFDRPAFKEMMQDVTDGNINCVIVKDLDFTLMRGDRLGLIGRNGAGKSTLIKLLLGKIQPDAGTVKLGTNIKLAYFDQLREQLDLTKTVAETISPGSDWVEIGGERKHIIAYLGDFLFPPRRANVPVSSLSGGERNRLLLARLFALPANLLVLDEPTNDLDIDSLELLEQTLAVYPGTIILVSHDRRFLDNVVTEVLAPEGDGKWREYVGGYTEWFTQRQQENDPFAAAKTEKKAEKTEKPAKNEKPRDVIPQKIKLSWREARELEALPEKLEAMEKEQASIINAMSAFDYHSKSVEDIKADKLRLEELEKSIADGWTRWEALSEKESLSTGK